MSTFEWMDVASLEQELKRLHTHIDNHKTDEVYILINQSVESPPT